MSKDNIFFFTMVISLIGNAVADYAILWHAIHTLDLSNINVFDNKISAFYIGQALGTVFLAPCISVFIDRISKLRAAVLLDIAYGLALLMAIFLYQINQIKVWNTLALVFIIAGISTVYRSFVGFSAIKSLEKGGINLVPKLIKTISLSHLAGAGLSGVMYYILGFQGSMLFGIVTFLPALFFYKKVLSRRLEGHISNKNFKNDFLYGLKILKNDKYILNVLISIMIFNISGAIIPSVLGIKFKIVFGERSDLFGYVIATGLLIGFFLTNKLAKLSEKVKISNIVPYSVIPIIVFSLLAMIFKNAWFFVGIYFTACVASAFRNVATGSLRVNRIPKEAIGKVNTVYMAILYMGQFIGGLCVLPMFSVSFNKGLIVFVLFMVVSIVYSFFMAPKVRLKDAI